MCRVPVEPPHEALSIGGAVDFEVAYNHVYDSDKEGIDIKETSKRGKVHHNLVETSIDKASTSMRGSAKSATSKSSPMLSMAAGARASPYPWKTVTQSSVSIYTTT